MTITRAHARCSGLSILGVAALVLQLGAAPATAGLPLTGDTQRGMSDLGTIGGSFSYATAGSGPGLTVGWSTAADGTAHGVAWGHNGRVHDLGQDVNPMTINSSGTVAGAVGAAPDLRAYV